MRLWNYYFIAKLALFFGKYIGFHRLENLCFAAVLLLPIKSRSMAVVRQLLAVPVGIGLLYYDSWLPPVYRLFSQADQLGNFSPIYLIELLGRFINGTVIAWLSALFLLVVLLGKKLRISTLTLITLAFAPQIMSMFRESVPIAAPIQACLPSSQTIESSESTQTVVNAPVDDMTLSASLEKFYVDEASRQVNFPKIKADENSSFDLIFLHICSLSWDDLQFTQEKSPLLSRFHILYTHFNSAATYSGPAGIRLLRGSCGQTKHKDLYNGALPQCYLFNELADAGFNPKLLLNHDGHFGNFLQDVQQQGGLNIAPSPNKDAPIHMHSFDGSPIYEDYALLDKWRHKNLTETNGPVALYYNTISLHDGNRIPGIKSQHSLDTYPSRLKKLLTDIDRFIGDLEHSGRKAVVVFVAEHGAALHSDQMQISGMREIPSPRITLVPAGIRLVGLPADTHISPVTISASSSYLSLSTVLARMIEFNPFTNNGNDLTRYIEQLPKTEFVAENEETVIMRRQSKYHMHTPDGVWIEYEPELAK